MSTWKEYKEHVKATDPEAYKDMKEAEQMAALVGKLIQQRNAKGLSQRDLAALCGLPQSSVARIESGKTTPNLNTLLKLISQLDLRLELLVPDQGQLKARS